MNVLDSQMATAQELVAFARQRGVDLAALCHDWAFLSDGRFISIWRSDGELYYSLQGPVRMLPQRFMASATAFHGMWTEAGKLSDLEAASKFLPDWLIGGKEVDELPQRQIRREAIG